MLTLSRTIDLSLLRTKMAIRKAPKYSTDYKAFNELLNSSRNIVVLTGAGVSAESGIPTFRGPGGIWRSHRAADLATPMAFRTSPSLVWEFYHYRRETAFRSEPNKAHLALAKYEQMAKEEGRNFVIITQNVDGLHQRAGSTDVIELHGSLSKVICTGCKSVYVNTDSPICPALKGRENYNFEEKGLPLIEVKDLPKCSKCQSLVRPYIVWFGETLNHEIMHKARKAVKKCDLCMVVGTSSVVFPAATFAPLVVDNGKPVAEFNLEPNPASTAFQFYFSGPCGTTLPLALGVDV